MAQAACGAGACMCSRRRGARGAPPRGRRPGAGPCNDTQRGLLARLSLVCCHSTSIRSSARRARAGLPGHVLQVLHVRADARGRLGGAVRGGGPPGGAADAGRGGRRRGARELRHPRVHAGAPRRRGATCGHTCILGWSGVLPTPCAAPRAPSAPQAPYLPLLCSSCRGAVVRLHMLPSGAPAGQHALASPTLSYMPSFIACCLHHRHGCARLPPSTPHPPFAPMVRS